jgi:hypothetical protein
MPKFRKKPVVIEAVRWMGGNLDEIETFIGEDAPRDYGVIVIHTLEGAMRASVGDWIIKGVKGEIYPCKPDIFDATYEPVND